MSSPSDTARSPASSRGENASWECAPLADPEGFREYDARWRYPEQINLMGAQAVGLGLGALLQEQGAVRVVTGHDYRRDSAAIKQALITGLMSAGMQVLDIGLALSPTAYFAQGALDAAVAMVTASHNEAGWVGLKMGASAPLTFGAEDMARLKARVLAGAAPAPGGGSYAFVADMAERYMADLTARPGFARPLTLVVSCGNGTAGAFAPPVLERLGAQVIPLHCDLDWTFPHGAPNPENVAQLRALRDKVLETPADLGLAFDGDGDRCGIVDNRGREIFADKVGVLLARELSARHPDARFVADIKSTILFTTDPVLAANGAQTRYGRTGHSHMKRQVQQSRALAGFEKSGHYMFSPPLGRGYDDGLLAAIAICDMLHGSRGSMADLVDTLPVTYASPTMSPHCPDKHKYEVVEQVTRIYQDAADRGETVAGCAIGELMTINGVRVALDDGTWGLVRASSNTPGLVVVVESPVSRAQMRAMFADIKQRLAGFAEVGAYDQQL